MVGIVVMVRRLVAAIRYAARDEGFRGVFGAAVSMIALGTAVYSLGEGWSVWDGFYFAVCTLTTSNISDPHLVLTTPLLRIFTAFYVLVGIGILVETARRIGLGYVAARSEHGIIARRHHEDPDPDPS
ncbi:MAG: potassium channel family protein [Solirubrobacteraceae bacterium]